MSRYATNPAEVNTEKIFRDFYNKCEFIEKAAIPKAYGFKSKNINTDEDGYPDFFLDCEQFCIVVEAKKVDHERAQSECQFYMINNKIKKDIIGIAISGQKKSSLNVTYYLKLRDANGNIIVLYDNNELIKIEEIVHKYLKYKYGNGVNEEDLIKEIKSLNKKFQQKNIVRDTHRSLFFSAIMIALKNKNFRSQYMNCESPGDEESGADDKLDLLPESYNLNELLLKAVNTELKNKLNNYSKKFVWINTFSFINNINCPLQEYKDIIKNIEYKIFIPFEYGEKQDILGKAYRIFLSRAGRAEDKNIILTPDHIRHLMIKLACLTAKDVVLDTCTGTGGFLLDAMEHMISLDENEADNIKKKRLIGFETDEILFTLACSNMFLHGDGFSNIIFRSSLIGDESEAIVNNNNEDLFEYIRKQNPTKVIINPPYEDNKPINFVLSGLKYLEDEHGKLIVIMPTNTLIKNEGGLTERVLEIGRLDAVIRMPEKLFSEQGRAVDTSIFCFTKTKHKDDDVVVFYDLIDDGFEGVQHKGRVDKNNNWHNIENDIYNAIYTNSCGTEYGTNFRRCKIYRNGILKSTGYVEHKTNNIRVKINEVFLSTPGTLASGKSEAGEYPFITGDASWKTHKRYDLDTEAIVYVIGAAGSLGRTHYVNGKFTASNLCLVLTNKMNKKYPVDMRYYNYYFKSIKREIVSDIDIINPGSKKTINKVKFENSYIDYVPYDEQVKFVNSHILPFEQIEKEYLEARKIMDEKIEMMSKKNINFDNN